MRGKPPTPLADALGSWLNKSGLARRLDLAQAVDHWAATVGPQIAAVTRAEAVNAEGTLWVRVVSSAWANELSLMAPRILAKLNQNRRGQIKEIRWLTGLAGPEPRQEE
jgi:predicted nucleic acid-binding Zn ribbon protein